MDMMGWILAGGGGVVCAGLVACWVFRRRQIVVDMVRVRQQFHRQREWLEAKFLTLNKESHKPRGLEWVECDFSDEVSFARDRHTHQLRALAAVTIRFEAIEGGGMEDNPNVHNLRAATAVFFFDGAEWTTDGRTVFNKNPQETIRHFQHELEVVE